MKDVMTQGTGTPAYFGSSMAQAGKSGTTTKNRDALFAGFTPYYTCVVWGGFDDNSPQSGGQTTYPKKIWKAVMSRIHENLEYQDSQNQSDRYSPGLQRNPENLQSPVSVMRIHAAVRSIPNILLKVHSLPNIVTIISLQISAMLPASLPVVTARQIPFPPEYSSLAERLEQRILHIF